MASPDLIHLLPGHPAQVLLHTPLVNGLDLSAAPCREAPARGCARHSSGGLGRLLAGLGRDGRDDQRGAVVVAGVVLQDDHRAGAALLGAYGGRGWQSKRRPCGKSSFPSCGFSVPFFFFRYSSKRKQVMSGYLAVVSVLYVHIASPCPLSFWFFGYVRSQFVLDAPRAGRASDGGVLHRSIGIEPPRLHCGRAANYGSIIVPNTCRRLHREQPGFYRVKLYRSLMGFPSKSGTLMGEEEQRSD